MLLPGRESLVAIVTHGGVDNLGLAEGVDACALFKASSVIIGVKA